MDLVPFLSKYVSDPWSSVDEQEFSEHGSYLDRVLYIPSIHAKLRLIEKNVYLCSIKTKNGLYKNFHILPETRSSFYYLAYIPQIGFVHKLNEANISENELPKNSIFRDLLSNYNCYCKNGYDISEDESIIEEHILVKVNSPFSDFLDKFNLGFHNFEIKAQFRMLNLYYSDIQHDYYELIHNSSIQSKLKRHGISQSIIHIGKNLLISGLVGITIDNFVDWGAIGGTTIDFNADFNYQDTIGEDNLEINISDTNHYNLTESSNLSFEGAYQSCWEQPECKKSHLAQNGTYHVVTGL